VTDEQIIQIVRTIALPIIVTLVIAIALRQLGRIVRHARFGEGRPEILTRDVLFFLGLSFLFIVPAAAGMLGIILATNPIWVILSSTIAISLLAVFAYYEYVVIGRTPNG
jgi:hypothetical protein